MRVCDVANVNPAVAGSGAWVDVIKGRGGCGKFAENGGPVPHESGRVDGLDGGHFVLDRLPNGSMSNVPTVSRQV